MAAVSITFTDGRTEEVNVNPRCMVEAERRYGDMSLHGYEATLYGAWFRLGKPDTFDGWLDTIESMDQPEDKPADPTGPGASDGS